MGIGRSKIQRCAYAVLPVVVMQRAFYILASLFIIVLFCGYHQHTARLSGSKKKTTVLLQPLGVLPNGLLSMLQDSVPHYLPVSITIGLGADRPAFAYYQPRNRYKADSLLVFLKTRHVTGANIVAGITAKDMSTHKGTIADYGIMGLGLQPGNECIISTYRLYKSNPSQQLLQQRLLKTVVHELGHNFGLPHCPNKHCIMADADGRLTQDNEDALCDDCKRKLRLLQ